jgi:hypothetical protein
VSSASGQIVTLSALTSSDPNLPVRPLTYLWSQTAGPVAVALAGANTGTPTFTAPKVTAATTFSFNVAVTNSAPLTSSANVSVSVKAASPLPTLSFSAPGIAPPGSVVAMIGMVSSGSTFTWTQTAGPLVTLNAGASLSPNFTAPLTPANITFVLTATTTAGASATVSRAIVISGDTVAIGTTTWDNRKGKGQVNIVATSNAITGATAPAGLAMTVTLWNVGIDAGLPGSASNPVIAPMSVVANVFGQLPVCPTDIPCFIAPLVSQIAGPGSTSYAQVFLPPTTIVVKSTWGGMATISGAAIKVVQ